MNDETRITLPGKHTSFRALESDPPNGGAAADKLIENVITPMPHFFVRSHAPTPQIDPETYELTVRIHRDHVFSLVQLQREFPYIELTATLQCAGNRRVEMQHIAPIPGELIWDREAISTAVWSGVRLRDVLIWCGMNSDWYEETSRYHVLFEGLDQCEKDGETFPFGGSIPLEKAFDPNVLLADRMNGEPLLPEHGAPLRVFVPGYIGARSVKWVSRITVAPHPSDNYYQAHAYKLFAPSVQPDTVDWGQGLMLGELSINSAIMQPEDGATLPVGRTTIRGWAMSGGRGVARVDVSLDGGTTWGTAQLDGEDLPFAWRLWSFDADLMPGQVEIVARAWDKAANTQPDHIIWNFKGYMNNACPRARVVVT
jgi:sulfite oxidase